MDAALDRPDPGGGRRARVGGEVNDVPTAPSRTVREIVRANIFTRFNALLGGMLVVILIVGPIQDALFGGVLIANAVIGIVQELRAKRTLDRLAVLTAPESAGRPRRRRGPSIAVSAVVLDDVLELQPGDQVVVDGEVLDAQGLELDESLLSGESEPVEKRAGRRGALGLVRRGGWWPLPRHARRPRGVRRAPCRGGASVHAHALGTAGGDRQDPADRDLADRADRDPAGDQPAAGERVDARTPSGASVAGTVAMVPEGLVLLTSVAFAVGVVRLARRRVLVQELPAVEVLARVDVVCVDKTGTLTEGRLAVEEVEVLDGGAEHAACTRRAGGERTANPNATLLAIGEAFPDLPEGWRCDRGGRRSRARGSGARPPSTGEGRGCWARPTCCSARRRAGRPPRPASSPRPDAASSSSRGATPGSATRRCRTGLEPVAIVVLGDRIRETAGETLRYFAEQGVEVKVISGDHPQTVAAIAGHLALVGAEDAMDARELPEDPVALAEALEAHTVFGRVTPQQKREMVQGPAGHGTRGRDDRATV